MRRALALEIPEDTYNLLRKKAKQTGQSTETLAVELLHAALHAEADPLECFIGAFDSQGSDWADQHDQHLGRQLASDCKDA